MPPGRTYAGENCAAGVLGGEPAPVGDEKLALMSCFFSVEPMLSAANRFRALLFGDCRKRH